MEYAQRVIVQIAAGSVDEVSAPDGLLVELEEHRAFLQEQPGFEDMRLTRTPEPGGQVRLDVETRWRDQQSLAQYEAGGSTVAGIVRKHQGLLVPDSLEVSDSEAPGPAAPPGPPDVRERLFLPLLVPLGAFLFGVLVIYGLSRIYLEIPSEAATGLALGVATSLLLVAWYLATSPRVPRWQIAAIGLAAAALLAGGAIFAAVHEEEGETAPKVSEGGGAPPAAASPEASPAAPIAGADVTIAMVPTIKFGETELKVQAGTELTLAFDNRDTGLPHNWALYTDDSASEAIAGENENICTAPCTAKVTFGPLEPGSYFFRCDVHPTQMTGTLIAE